AAPAAASVTTGWIRASGGSESDLAVAPGPAPTVVPGGPFAALQAGGTVAWGRPGRMGLAMGGQAWTEHFLDAGGRRVGSGAVLVEATVPLYRHWALRAGGGGHVFDDSARETARRIAGWSEAGIVMATSRWRLEAQAGLEARRYPDFLSIDDTGAVGVYTERQANAGLHASWAVMRGLVLRGSGHLRRTDARDPWFDDRGPTVEASVETALGRGFGLEGDAFLQERRFPERPDDRDRDHYRQAGLAVTWSPAGRWQVRLAGARARYTWPDGTVDDDARWQLGVTLRLGGADLPDPARLPRDDDPATPRAGRPIELRVHAPGAAAVALVGDFNGWDPGAAPLTPGADGWWSTRILLPAGTHAYAYVVDGAWLTPPEASATEDDGFGGRNGLLVVMP
ncbi:MAG TPA: isoamylase early set domain-containing protein, partial [Candidatus Krumholzibacteria bacterium]|nr:isoamylase early set domain-containing protein [Candidatus Krumholzibacteria bacterium]